jgi:hypothetical protein
VSFLGYLETDLVGRLLASVSNISAREEIPGAAFGYGHEARGWLDGVREQQPAMNPARSQAYLSEVIAVCHEGLMSCGGSMDRWKVLQAKRYVAKAGPASVFCSSGRDLAGSLSRS